MKDETVAQYALRTIGDLPVQSEPLNGVEISSEAGTASRSIIDAASYMANRITLAFGDARPDLLLSLRNLTFETVMHICMQATRERPDEQPS